MAYSVAVRHRTDKTRSDGRAPVWIRVTINRKSRYVSTGVRIHPTHWNETKHEVRKTHELAASYNQSITNLRLQIEAEAQQSGSAAAVKDAVTRDQNGLSAYLSTYIERLDGRDQYWERKKYVTTRNKLHSALGSNLSWDDLTPDALAKVERYCREQKGNSQNTTRKELVRLRTLVNRAIKEGVLDAARDPFRRYDLPAHVPPDRRSLSEHDIKALLDLECSGKAKRARDAFVFAFYGGGIRFSDICQLRPADVSGTRLRYRMMKTGRIVSLELPPQAVDIATWWRDAHEGPFLFSFLAAGEDQDPVLLRKRISSCNVMANRRLKRLAKEAGIRAPDEVTFHVARHSFADVARKRSGDLYAVSKALGHSSLSVTESYLASFDQDAVDTLTSQMWSDDR